MVPVSDSHVAGFVRRRCRVADAEPDGLAYADREPDCHSLDDAIAEPYAYAEHVSIDLTAPDPEPKPDRLSVSDCIAERLVDSKCDVKRKSVCYWLDE